jgi:hypothetical protein
MKLFITQFSPTFCRFISLQSKYSSQHPVLKTHSVYVSPLESEARFHTIQNNRQNYSFLYSNFYVYGQRTRRQKVPIWMVGKKSWSFSEVLLYPTFIWAHWQKPQNTSVNVPCTWVEIVI